MLETKSVMEVWGVFSIDLWILFEEDIHQKIIGSESVGRNINKFFYF